jgi:sugar phosphate isomerase/epimerase
VSPIGVCAGFIYTSPQRSDEQQEYSALEKMLDATAALGAPALTTVIIGEPHEDVVQEYSYVADKLHHLAEMAASRGVRINLEFLGDASQKSDAAIERVSG